MFKGRKYQLYLGRQGMNLNANPDDIDIGSLQSSKNLTLHQNSIQKDFGESNVNSTTLGAKVLAGIDYYPTPDTQDQVIYLSDGTLKKSVGIGTAAFSSLVSGLSTDAIGQFLVAGNETASMPVKLFFFNGEDYPQVLSGDGSTTDRIGLLGSITNKLSTTNADATMNVELTAHGLTSGDTVSLVGFTNPLNGQDPNVVAAAVTVINANNFTVELAGNANATVANTGGTGSVYAHPADWTGTTQPEGAVLHRNRIHAFLRHTIYISDDDNNSKFEGSDVFDFQVRPDIGAKIQAIASIYGRLVIFKKPYGIVHLEDATSSTPDVRVTTSASGIAGKNAVCQAGSYLYFIASNGSIHRLIPTDTNELLKDQDVTGAFYLNNEIRSRINSAQIEKAVLAYDSINQTLMAALPSASNDDNDFIVRMDLNDESKPKITFTEEKGSYISIWKQISTTSEERLVAGTNSGFIVNILDDDRTAATGSAVFPWVFPVLFDDNYESQFRTVETDFSDQFPDGQDQNKQLYYVELVVEPTQGDFDLMLNIYADGTLADQIHFNKTTSAATFPLTFPVTFREENIQNLRESIQGVYGKRFSFEGINESTNQNFRITKLLVGFETGDERIF